MPRFSVDLEALLAGVDRMSATNSSLEQTLATVRASMAALGLTWYGEAA